MCFPTIWSLQWCDCWIVLSCFIDSCNIDYMILYKLYIGYCFIFNTIWPYGLPDIAQEDAAVKRLVADLERARRSWIFKLGMMDLVTLWYVHLRYLRQMVIWKLIWINVFLRIYYIYKYIRIFLYIWLWKVGPCPCQVSTYTTRHGYGLEIKDCDRLILEDVGRVLIQRLAIIQLFSSIYSSAMDSTGLRE